MEASVPDDVVEVLNERFGNVVKVGAGAWSTAFRFRSNGQDLVVRVGEHDSDFRVDAEMSPYGCEGLPIPEVIELDRLDPPHNHLYLCVSRFAEGQPLELVSASEWATLVREVANMLGVMRTITPPARSVVPTWPEVLLGHDTDDTRLDGWQAKLVNYPDLLEPYQTAQERLRRLCALPPVANVSPSLLHCDLINRNVHVNHGAITGVFDWGCRRWGDHLYDLAWFEFWAPWHRSIDVDALRSELVNRWGYTPNQDRLDACLTHIGVDHLVYNAMVGDHCSGREVSDRLIELGLI